MDSSAKNLRHRASLAILAINDEMDLVSMECESPEKEPELGFIYIINTEDYVKFGITTNPAKRLENHEKDLKQELVYDSLWRGEMRMCRKVESAAKIKMSSFPNVTRERIHCEVDDVKRAIKESMEFIGGSYEERTFEEAFAESGCSFKISVTLDANELSVIDRERSKRNEFIARQDLLREVILLIGDGSLSLIPNSPTKAA